MLVFVLGNICNFIAFNFAAQSLLAPLNSISLVVNVFIAPIINGEIWGWNDVVGIILIICGSTMVVVFAGFPPKDYTTCVLLKLFQRTGTIIFLTVTVFLVIVLFFYILIVEKNLDFRNSKEIDDQVFEGELVQVEANIDHLAKRLSVATIRVEKEIGKDGELNRIVTVLSPIPLVLEKDPLDNTNNNDADQMPLDQYLRNTETESVHSLELRFRMDSSSKRDEIVENSVEFKEVEPRVASLPLEPTLFSKLLSKISTVPGFKFVKNIQPPTLKQKIKLDSWPVVYGLPLSYASLGVNI